MTTSLTNIINEEVAKFKEDIKLIESGEKSRYSLVFSESLLTYVLQKMDPKISCEDAKANANLLLNYFGTNNFIIDNRLNHAYDKDEIRGVLNILEDTGLIKTERTEELVYIFNKKALAPYLKGWRIHYWVWNYHKIFEAIKDKPKESDEFGVYNHLPDENWARSKT